MRLSDPDRELVKKTLYQILMDTMFGDGLEEEYIFCGITWKGLNYMTDQELVEELKIQVGADDSDFDPDLEDPSHVLYISLTAKGKGAR